MSNPPKRVWVIEYSDGSYYSNKSGSSLPTIFRSYAKAASRVMVIMPEYGPIPTVQMWDITETRLGPTQFNNE